MPERPAPAVGRRPAATVATTSRGSTVTRIMSALLVALLVVPATAGVAGPAAAAAQRPPVRTTAEGFTYVADDGPLRGDGRRRTYRVEVEPAADVSLRWVTRRAEHVLGHRLAWTGAGDWALRRVRRRPDIRIVIATPSTVDRLCARAGLRTVGRLSCWNGRFAAINVDRWKRGSKGFVGPLHVYRRYVLNHEVGHALGYGHRACSRRGALAPVMQQQTFATRPCRANGWPALDP